MGKVIAAYGGGFKPPTGGHFEIVKNALAEFPEIDEFIIYVGSKERDGIDQAEAILVWEIYENYLANKVVIKPAKSPIGDILRLAKDNPQDEIYFVIGYREGRDDDMKDVASRTSNLEKKYPNIEVKVMPTFDANMSGTNARKAIGDEEKFIKFLPDEVQEKSQIWNIVRPAVEESITENATYSQNIDYMQMISDLTNYMIEKGRNIEPLPELVIKNGETENAKNFFGRTAYYDPNTQTIVLYTEGRHPKDIVRSYAHEMVHHTQYLEDRLPNVQTTDTTASKELDAIEREAYLDGNMIFRNWTDSIDGDVYSSLTEKKDPKKGTGKKPEGSKRRLYTDEDPKDTVGIKFSTRQDIVDTLNKASFKAKSHARQSQIINLIHQRVRAAYGRAKDPDVKKRLKTGLDYIKDKKEASKKKTQRLKKLKESKIPSRWERRVTIPGPVPPAFLEGDVLTYEGYKKRRGNVTGKLAPQRDYPVEVIEVKWNEDKKEYVYKVMLLRDLGYGEKRGMKVTGKSEKQIRDKLAKKQLTRAEFERQPTNRKDSFDKPIKLPKMGSPFGWTGESKSISNLNWQSKVFKPGPYKPSFLEGDLLTWKDGREIKIDRVEWTEPDDFWKLQGRKASYNIIYVFTDNYDKTGNKFSEFEHDFKKYLKEEKDYFGLNKLIREIVEEPKYKIFSDMDGVLTDFEGRFEKYSDGLPPRDYEKKFGKDKFWELVDGEGVAFWVGMPWMSDGERYWDYIKDYDTELLSSPSRSNTSRLGKRLWVRNNMPGVKLTLAQAYLKKNYAAPNHILIDDRKSNIDEWRAEGGIGILHTSAADTIQQLKKLGL